MLATLSWVQGVHAAGMGTRGGSIINIASVAGLRPAPGISFYGISKAAVVALTASLAVELGPAVRVNAVAPALVKTKFAEALYAGREAEVAAQYPLGRLGERATSRASSHFLPLTRHPGSPARRSCSMVGLTLTRGVG